MTATTLQSVLRAKLPVIAALCAIVITATTAQFAIAGRRSAKNVWGGTPEMPTVAHQIKYEDLCTWNRTRNVTRILGNNVYVANPDDSEGARRVARFGPKSVDAPLEPATVLELLAISWEFDTNDLAKQHDRAMHQRLQINRPPAPPAPPPLAAQHVVFLILVGSTAFVLGRITKQQSVTYTYQPDVATARADAEFSARLRDATTSLERYRDHLKGRTS